MKGRIHFPSSGPPKMSIPLFPDLTPRIIDPLWFGIDKSASDETELLQLEHEHKSWLQKIAQKDSDVIPIGKTATEREEDDEEEEDEDDSNDDEESESQDEEDEDMEVDVTYDRGDPTPSADS
ncbi:anaphase promoting complex subunit 15 [Nesidiocoris tenuis]|uniref:Anaphase promoting complex subunit 15 n=1 Tax=Nesidiocoris tenuis TaxID=355587 RepID=A0ABN7AQY1_9HEMI|nr:anaphase promoting complex subunit 15 [Nesidiocoris tenuis]